MKQWTLVSFLLMSVSLSLPSPPCPSSATPYPPPSIDPKLECFKDRRTDQCWHHSIQTTISVFHYAAYRSPDNFAYPDDFVPERWLDDPRFKNDAKTAFQPFSHGPRNCLGRKYVPGFASYMLPSLSGDISSLSITDRLPPILVWHILKCDFSWRTFSSTLTSNGPRHVLIGRSKTLTPSS